MMKSWYAACSILQVNGVTDLQSGSSMRRKIRKGEGKLTGEKQSKIRASCKKINESGG